MELIRERIKEALNLRGMMPVDLARKSGINKGSISKYLSGDVIPKQSAIGLMADALMVSPSWLMGYDVPMEINTLPNGGYHGSSVTIPIEYDRLNEINKAKVQAYCQALLDTQEDKK